MKIETNNVYCMDNLELLKQLNNNTVDLIYCDILYNTGKKFKDYNDDLGTPQEAMEWYEPRLNEMRRVLKNTGSIYLQCDYRLVHYLKVKLDDIFGIRNFVNEIIWSYKTGGRSKTSFSKKHDNILWYSKSSKFTFNQESVGITRGIEKKNNMKRNIDENGKVYFSIKSNGKIYKYYEDDLIVPSDVWNDISHIQQKDPQRVGYDTQKPKSLLERIIKASSNKGDVVADFFCGSGTSLVVAKELDRNYIGCDINPRAIEITKSRLKEIEDGKK